MIKHCADKCSVGRQDLPILASKKYNADIGARHRSLYSGVLRLMDGI